MPEKLKKSKENLDTVESTGHSVVDPPANIPELPVEKAVIPVFPKPTVLIGAVASAKKIT